MKTTKTVFRFLAVAALWLLSLTIFVTSAYAQTMKRPLSKEDVVKLLEGHVPPERVGELARDSGIDFEMTPETKAQLHNAGATDALLATLLDLAPKGKIAQPAAEVPTLLIQSNPGGAHVYVDDELLG